jgi:hypothetical protein
MNDPAESEQAHVDAAVKRKRSKRWRTPNLNVVLTVLVAAALVAWVTSNGIPSLINRDDDRIGPDETNAETEAPSEYHARRQLCEGLDLSLYKEVVGMKATTDDETFGKSGHSVNMGCFLYSGGNDKSRRVHKLIVSAEQYDSRALVEPRYEHLLKVSGVTEKDKDVVEGPWKQGIIYISEDTYVLTISDDTLVLNLKQSVDPLDAMETDDAMQLMTTYAMQTLKYLKA